MAHPLLQLLLARVFGPPGNPRLESLLFRTVLMMTAVLCLLSAFINMSSGLSSGAIVVPFFAAAYFLALFVVVRRVANHVPIVWCAALGLLLFIAYAWVNNGGSAGASHSFLIIAPLIFVAFVEGLHRVALFALFIAVSAALVVAEHSCPGLVVPYPNATGRLLDVLAGTALTQAALAVSVMLVVREFRGLAARLDKQRQLSEERFGAMAEDVPAFIVEAGLDLKIEYANRAALEAAGYTQADIDNGLPLETLLHPDDLGRALQSVKQMMGGEAIHAREYRLRTKSGETRRVLVNSAPRMLDGRVDGFRAYMVDVTALKQLELQYLQAQKMESVGMLAGGLAHDFNNILTAILGYGHLIDAKNHGAGGAVLDEELDEAARTIIGASERAAGLVRKLLVFSRREPFRSEVFDLRESVREVETLLRHSLPKQIHLELHMPAEPAELEGDRSLVQSALLNLRVNSRDAMPEGGTLTVSLDTSEPLPPPHHCSTGVENQQYARLRVVDTGVGMSATVKKHLFEPFFTTKQPGKGTGLGLASVYGTVQAHRGHIDVRSEAGSGASITVWLPLTQLESEPRSVSTPGSPHAGGTVLVVDDEEHVLQVVVEVLRGRGYKPIAFARGEDAVGFADSHRGALCCAVVDVVMPGISGVETVLRMHKSRPQLPVVLITGFSAGLDTQALVRKPHVYLLMKPFDPPTLLSAVGKAAGAPSAPDTKPSPSATVTAS